MIRCWTISNSALTRWRCCLRWFPRYWFHRPLSSQGHLLSQWCSSCRSKCVSSATWPLSLSFKWHGSSTNPIESNPFQWPNTYWPGLCHGCVPRLFQWSSMWYCETKKLVNASIGQHNKLTVILGAWRTFFSRRVMGSLLEEMGANSRTTSPMPITSTRWRGSCWKLVNDWNEVYVVNHLWSVAMWQLLVPLNT